MSVTYRCSNIQCKKVLLVPENMRGKNVRCSYCSTTHIVPKKKPKAKKKVVKVAPSGDSE